MSAVFRHLVIAELLAKASKDSLKQAHYCLLEHTSENDVEEDQ